MKEAIYRELEKKIINRILNFYIGIIKCQILYIYNIWLNTLYNVYVIYIIYYDNK